ncbi:MAG: hypothetical protein ACRCW6_01235 [Mycoplasmoidaceae bacterium]
MKKNKYIKWFFLTSTALGSLTSFTIYNSLKKANNKSIKIDYNKVASFVNDKKIKRSLFSDGINNNSFDKEFNQQINDFKNKNFSLNDIKSYADKQLTSKQLNKKNITSYHKNSANISLKDKEYLSNPNNFFSKISQDVKKLSSSDGTWDNYVDKNIVDWTKVAKVLSDLEIAAISFAVILTAAAAGYLVLAFFTFGETIEEAAACFKLVVGLSVAAVADAGVLAAINSVLVYNGDDRYNAVEKLQNILTGLLVPAAAGFGLLSVSISEWFCVCPAVLVVVGMVAAVTVSVTKVSHDRDEKNYYFEFHKIHYNKSDVSHYGLKINGKDDIELTIDAKHNYAFKENYATGINDLKELIGIIPKVPHDNLFKFHGIWFDTDDVSSYCVNVVNDKNTTFVINDGSMHQFSENIADANKDYDYLQSFMQNEGKGMNFNFHGQSFDITKINSFDVQIIDNNATTLTIDDGQKHQFKQNLNDSNKDYDYLQSIILGRGQGENFKFHDKLFNIRNINSFGSSIVDNKTTTLTIDDGQKHQFNESLAKANEDYDYLLSIMPNQGQGEIFKFHDQSFDLRKVNSYDVQVIDDKNTTLTINDGQKHQFKQNLDDANRDYDYLQSIMPTKGQGENFIIHNESFDLRKVNSFDVQVIDAKTTILTINDGKKRQFTESLADATKDYDYLQSIMPGKGRGENFNFHGQSFDLRKVNSFDVKVIDAKTTILTINDGKKHQFNQNLDDSNKDYAYLQSIMPGKGQGENFKFHDQSFDITKVASYNVQVIDAKTTTLTINDGQKHQFKQNLNDSNKDYAYLLSIMPKHGQGENFNFHGQMFDITKINSYDVQVIDDKTTTLTIDDGKKHQFKQNLNDSNKDYAYLQSIMSTKGQGENFKFHDQSFDITKVNSYDVQVIDNKNTTLTINDGQKHQFKQSLADANKDYAYLLSIMPGKEQGENFKFHDQSFDITKVVSYDVKVIDDKKAILTINDGNKHQFTENLADANKDYAYLQSIIPDKGQGEIFKFHNESYNLGKINNFKVKVIDPDYTILTINDGQDHIYKEKLSQSKSDYAYLSSITTNDGQGINYLDWNLIESASVLIPIILLIGLLIIGLETKRRRSLINNKYNINVKKPNLEYRNPNFQLKRNNFEIGTLNLGSTKPSFEYRNPNFQLARINSWSNKPKLELRKPNLEYRNPDLQFKNQNSKH